MQSVGSKIIESRKAFGMKAADLASEIGISPSMMSYIEKDGLKGGPDPHLIVKISDALNDKTILTTYLENNPAYQAVIPKIFTDLNNIRRDPAIIFNRFASEAQEAVEAARILADIFSDADPSRHPNFCEVLFSNLEQLIDVQRCSEIVFLQLIAAGVISDADRCEIHRRQQNKCVAHGHHRVDEQATGTEG